MNLSHFATSHIKAILFVAVVLCAVGAFTALSFPVSILPDVTFPRIKVIAEAGDRPSRLMEIAVTRPLEAAVSSVPQLTRLRSTTQRGASELSLDFADGTDMIQAQNLVNTKVNEVRASLPAEAQISVERMNPTVFPVLGLSLQSTTLSPSEQWSLATYNLRPRLARLPGVARVVVQGGRVPEIAVEVNPLRLAAYKLSLDDVQKALAQSNVARAVGRLDRQFQQYQTLVSGEITDTKRLGQIVVAQRGGVPLHLRDVATILPAVEDRQTVVTANGREGVLLNIVRQADANSLAVAAEVRAEMATMRAALPAHTALSVFYDQSILIGDAVSSVRDAVLIGAVLAVFVLLLFLGDWRATVVTGAIIPATVLISFLLMRLAGMTLNLMTLGALAVGIGLVIDDAIVVVENVFRHLAHGQSRAEAVRAAAAEIGAPMISSTLTTVVVFLPLSLLAGVGGAFFGALAVTLSIALMVSLVLALLLSPSLCAAFLQTRKGQAEHGRLFERVVHGYERVLGAALHRPLILPVAIALIVAATGFFGSHLTTGFMPTMDEGAFVLDFHTPPGTTLNESDRLLRGIEKILLQTPEVLSTSRRTGTELGFAITEPNRGDFAVMLKDGKRRGIETILEDLRVQVSEHVAGVNVAFIQVLQDLIGDLSGAPSPIEIKVFGESQAQISDQARLIAAKLEKIPGLVDVQSGVVESGPELVARIDEDKAGRLGLTADAVATQIQSALFGQVATQVLQGDRQIAVRVRFPVGWRSSRAALLSLPVRTPDGAEVPLASLGRIENVAGTSEIRREDQRRMVGVTAALENRDLGGAVTDVQKMMAQIKLAPGVTWSLGGQYQSQKDSFRNLLQVLGLAILLVFGVMLFQFGSFTAPLTILLVMPLSLFGVTLGLWTTGTPLNVSSFMGAIMLVGIVVKNGILLLDQAQKAEANGTPLLEAVLEAGRVRLRPILMTTLTAILGLVPLALGLGAGAEMQKPLAIAVIGGLSFSTLFTLLLAPLLYVSLRRWQLARVAAPVVVAD